LSALLRSVKSGAPTWRPMEDQLTRSEFVERDRQPPIRSIPDGQLVVTHPKVLHERVSRDHQATCT
jgi:hypothetical protein